jgi:hypothetical protein
MPELIQKKEEIDRHNLLLRTLSNLISQRAFVDYFHLEETLMHSKTLDTAQMETLSEQLLSDAKGSLHDKLRLFLIYYVCAHNVSSKDLESLMNNLVSNMNSDVSEQYFNDSQKTKVNALKYIIEHKKILSLGNSLMRDSEEKEDPIEQNQGSWFESGKSWLTKVQSMLPHSGKCSVTRIADAMMNVDKTSIATSSMSMLRSNMNPVLKNLDQNYATIDPLNMNDHSTATRNKLNFQEYQKAIVFMVGGGCFAEYANLSEFAVKKNRQTIYGCTDIVAPNRFLTQLNELGASN